LAQAGSGLAGPGLSMAIKSSRHDPEGLHPGRRHHWARSNGSGCGQFGALDDL